MTNLKEKAIRGFAWSAFGKISGTIVGFIVGFFLARLLSPDDFGTIGIPLVIFKIMRNVCPFCLVLMALDFISLKNTIKIISLKI